MADRIKVVLIDGPLEMSLNVYQALNKQVTNLTKKSIPEVLQLISELTQQTL
jgi:aspartate aminotransferase-like enzyme